MKTSRYSDGQILSILRQADGGVPVAELCREHGIVRRQNIWRNSRGRFSECGPRLGADVRRRACGVAIADARWSFV